MTNTYPVRLWQACVGIGLVGLLSACSTPVCRAPSLIQQQVLSGHIQPGDSLHTAALYYQNSLECINDTRNTNNLNYSLDWLTLAALNHNADAQFKLANVYLQGLGVRRDPQQAFYWMQQAAHAGDPYAQQALGFFYAQGIGTAVDAERAQYWQAQAKATAAG